MAEQCSRMGCDATRRYAALPVTRCSRTCREASASVQPDASALRRRSSAASTRAIACVFLGSPA